MNNLHYKISQSRHLLFHGQLLLSHNKKPAAGVLLSVALQHKTSNIHCNMKQYHVVASHQICPRMRNGVVTVIPTMYKSTRANSSGLLKRNILSVPLWKTKTTNAPFRRRNYYYATTPYCRNDSNSIRTNTTTTTTTSNSSTTNSSTNTTINTIMNDNAKYNGRKDNNYNNSIHLYDSLSQTCKAIPVVIPPKDSHDNHTNNSKGIAWYTCGPTVYDSAHLGHARTYVSLDILQRCLLHVHKMQCLSSGPTTTAATATATTTTAPPPAPIFIMNITNVDDKILARSKERNIPALELAEYYEREFWRDMDALNVMRPTIVTRVTDHVESSIIPYIQRIMDNGMAYRIDNDGVYFDVNKFEQRTTGGRYHGGKTNRYGKLAPGRMETLFAWGGMNHGNGPKKKDPRDFVLWKNRKVVSSSSTDNDQDVDHDHEQEDLLWDSPWGRGRPGWHIECSAMIESTMQLDFMRDHYKMQVHAGGIDLKFPHHTNEIAQAEAYHSNRQDENGHVQDGECDNVEEWIPHWVHTGHLHIDGLKMSKSLKNFITIRELLEEKEEGGSDLDGGTLEWLHSPADDFRLWCLGLSGSYRGPTTYSKSRLVQARIVREKIVRFLVDGEQWVKKKMSCSSSSLALLSSTFTAREFDLMQQTNKCQMTCLKIIFGLEKNLDNHHRDHLEFDGSAYLNALIDLSDAGNKYIAVKSAGTTTMTRGESSTVAVQQALGVLRECLAIVGFSDKTVRAGIFETAGSDNHDQEHIHSNSKLVQELVNFRKAVRELALEQVKRRGQGENVAMPHNSDFAKHLLTLCDKLRDEDLPKVGIEVFDSVGQDTLSDWRFIIPRDVTTHRDNDNVSSEPSKNLHREVTITESNFFKVGRYEGQFSAFDDHDFPTHDANGVELSKRMIKKLLKKKHSYFENKS